MKATAELINPNWASVRHWISVFSDLFKARLTTLVVITTVVGFYMGDGGGGHWALMLNTLLATALLASGAAALNQYLERDHDALMARTQDRPLPARRLRPDTVLLIGGLISAAGLLYLALAANLLTSLLGALTLISYLFIYTPLKRVTTLNTMVGAIPGALPPLMGWTAAQGQINAAGWSLFAILFFWQMPHFFAIAWMYRDQYRQAGFRMLPGEDEDGSRTAHQAVLHALGLLPISFCPFLFKLAGPIYLVGALLLGSLFLFAAVRFAMDRSRERARRLFLTSIAYLPLLLGLMVIDKIKF